MRGINTAINVIAGGVMLLAAIGIWGVWAQGQENRQWAAARKDWISECKGTVVNCAAAWDRSRTLRELYLDRNR